MYTVYIHRNKSNGKCYVGITSRKVNYRWVNGKGYLTASNKKYHQPKFAKAILKYGWDGFEHKILHTNLTEKQAKEIEQDLIVWFDSINNGYNITMGGESHLKYTDSEREQIKKERYSKSKPHLKALENREIRRKAYNQKIKQIQEDKYNRLIGTFYQGILVQISTLEEKAAELGVSIERVRQKAELVAWKILTHKPLEGEYYTFMCHFDSVEPVWHSFCSNILYDRYPKL